MDTCTVALKNDVKTNLELCNILISKKLCHLFVSLTHGGSGMSIKIKELKERLKELEEAGLLHDEDVVSIKVIKTLHPGTDCSRCAYYI